MQSAELEMAIVRGKEKEGRRTFYLFYLCYKRYILIATLTLIFFLTFNYGVHVIRIIAPCPSRSQLEFQLRD